MRTSYVAVALAIGGVFLAPISNAYAMVANVTANVATPQPTRFSVIVEGRGPDVILIPGLSTPRDVWRGTADALKANYRVHLIQINGFGSDAGVNANGPVLAPFVEELAAYISANKIDHPAIIGHSMGGLATLMLASRHPDLAGKIMIVDALPYIGTLMAANATVEDALPHATQMRAMMLNRPKASPSDYDIAARTAATMVKDTAQQKQVATWMRSADNRVVAQTMFEAFTTDVRPDLGKIIVPMTLLYAQDDASISKQDAERAFVPQYKGVAHFTPIMVPDSRHFIMFDQPDRFAKEVAAFLKR